MAGGGALPVPIMDPGSDAGMTGVLFGPPRLLISLKEDQ